MTHKNKQSGPDPIYQLLDGLFKGVWWLVSWPFRRGKGPNELDRARLEFQAYWAQVNGLVTAGQKREAIMRADILLDRALQWYQLPGTTLGERLKSASKRFAKATLDKAWDAHRVRNQLAHELQYQLTPDEAERTIANFRSVLRDLGLL